jgi:negative regulator of replication initiation
MPLKQCKHFLNTNHLFALAKKCHMLEKSMGPKPSKPVVEKAQSLIETAYDLLKYQQRDLKCNQAVKAIQQCSKGMENCSLGVTRFMRLLDIMSRLEETNDQDLIDKLLPEIGTRVSNFGVSLAMPSADYEAALTHLEEQLGTWAAAQQGTAPALTKIQIMLLALDDRLAALQRRALGAAQQQQVTSLQSQIQDLLEDEPYAGQIEAIEQQVAALESSP